MYALQLPYPRPATCSSTNVLSGAGSENVHGTHVRRMALLARLGNPGHPDDEEHDELKDWVGGSFDPEAFSVEAVNQQLRRFR